MDCCRACSPKRGSASVARRAVVGRGEAVAAAVDRLTMRTDLPRSSSYDLETFSRLVFRSAASAIGIVFFF